MSQGFFLNLNFRKKFNYNLETNRRRIYYYTHTNIEQQDTHLNYKKNLK